jgi:uncharacterized protein with HEPN domain
MKDRRVESRDRFVHIREAIDKIEVFIYEIGKDEFTSDQLVSSAVLFQFIVIVETINHIDLELLAEYPYPWHKVRSFRNLISHAYFQIKLDAVWEIIENDLQELRLLIETILKDEF